MTPFKFDEIIGVWENYDSLAPVRMSMIVSLICW